jgi:taurine transport system ATP-binding protein
MQLLEVKDAVVRYRSGGQSVTALDRVSLTIAPGEFVVALGASGCGKTTLLNVMAGFLPLSEGSSTLDRHPISAPGADRGVVFQHGALLPWLNVVDNVAFGLRLKGISKSERRARAIEMLRVVGLNGAENRRIWELSGGMRQRVGLARALTANPDLLFMDEPLGALDALTRELMQELILDVWSRTGKGIFFITHGIEEAVFLATKLLVMSPHPGRIVATLPLGFGRRYVAGESADSIKADPAFLETRERVKRMIFAARTHGEAPQ